MRYNSVIKIKERELSIEAPTYFIADVASNHNGSLERAKELIKVAAESGADAVKFQHFLAEKIVSDCGFKNLGAQLGHQSSWKKSVYEIYKECECNRDWNEILFETAQNMGVDFITTPYDEDAINVLNEYISAYKIGSGDITWTDFITKIAMKNKPVLLATGASSMEDVERAIDAILEYNKDIVLMQCNTNYTGDKKNFEYINLNVLKTYAMRYPSMVLGLSDHTAGHATVLGAIALGAKVIEKHFTLDNSLDGPDHAFSMNPSSWKIMIERSRELEKALGFGLKKIEPNEEEASIIQRRCARIRLDMKKGEKINSSDIEYLRPAEQKAVLPYQVDKIIGKILCRNKKSGEAFYFDDVEG